MRVSPLGVFGHDAPIDDLAAWARDDGALTHPHETCAASSAGFATTIAFSI